MDEVQTGLGRCGAAFAYQRYGLDPDLVTLAKSLGGGLPIGACIARNRALGVFGPGDHGSTFGGGPVVSAAALAILDLLAEEGLFSRVEELGVRLEGWLRRLEQAGLVTQVRRLGLMASCDLDLVRTGQDARQVVQRALEAGILLNATSETTLRFLPALIVSPEEIDRVGSFLGDLLQVSMA
jgi:acetylornithine/succinyldiaminopimelate/putrescine aminotransferase